MQLSRLQIFNMTGSQASPTDQDPTPSNSTRPRPSPFFSSVCHLSSLPYSVSWVATVVQPSLGFICCHGRHHAPTLSPTFSPPILADSQRAAEDMLLPRRRVLRRLPLQPRSRDVGVLRWELDLQNQSVLRGFRYWYQIRRFLHRQQLGSEQ